MITLRAAPLLFQIERIEAFGEPAVDRREQIASLIALAARYLQSLPDIALTDRGRARLRLSMSGILGRVPHGLSVASSVVRHLDAYRD